MTMTDDQNLVMSLDAYDFSAAVLVQTNALPTPSRTIMMFRLFAMWMAVASTVDGLRKLGYGYGGYGYGRNSQTLHINPVFEQDHSQLLTSPY